jgi:general secretion pathway protein A
MYTSFFGLNEKPFSITPDPRYLFMSERHTEALAHLIYGVKESGGFIQLTGEVGTGKTTLVRSLLQQLPESADVALVLNPQLSRSEFLWAICEELGVSLPEATDSINLLTNALNTYLLRNHGKGRRTILIVDEAQNLRVDVLEQIRLLTNLETTKQKLLQIILIGQPELRALLARNDMRQLAQRITGRYHLEPLSRDETGAYIEHRLKVAGGVGPIFSQAAKREIFRLARGIPRMINVIADRALLGAFTREERQLTPQLIRGAAAEVLDRGELTLSPWFRWLRSAGLATLAIAGMLALVWASNAWLAKRSSAPAWAERSEPVAVAKSDPALANSTARPQSGAALKAVTDVLDETAPLTTNDGAFETLFQLWGAAYQRGPVPACKQAERLNLYCLFQRGSLSQVRSMDRPAILTLRDPMSNQHQVVLSSMAEGVAVLKFGARDYPVATEDLAKFWYGEYLLLWRPQIGQVKSFFPGMRDQHVRWIRESLAAIQGEPVVPMGSDLYDEALEERVRNYQRERRLTVDGLVGHRTQIAINSEITADRPRLTRVN